MSGTWPDARWATGRGGRMQIEKDRAEILAGVRHGLTMGSPISMLVVNRDFITGKGPDGVPWTEEMSVAPSDVPFEPITSIRPGHADHSWDCQVYAVGRSQYPGAFQRS